LSVNLLQNKINTDQAGALVSMLKKHPTLKSICGNEGDETELDMSSKMSGAGDAIMLVAEIVDNGALTSLDVSNNGLGFHGVEHLSKALKGNKTVTELNVAENSATNAHDGTGNMSMSGFIALASAIKDMRALTSLNLAKNCLCGINEYGHGTYDASGIISTNLQVSHPLTRTWLSA
jgi:hypothetical protein